MTDLYVLPTFTPPTEDVEGAVALGLFEAGVRYLQTAETQGLCDLDPIAAASACAALAIAASDLESKGLLP